MCLCHCRNSESWSLQRLHFERKVKSTSPSQSWWGILRGDNITMPRVATHRRFGSCLSWQPIRWLWPRSPPSAASVTARQTLLTHKRPRLRGAAGCLAQACLIRGPFERTQKHRGTCCGSEACPWCCSRYPQEETPAGERRKFMHKDRENIDSGAIINR